MMKKNKKPKSNRTTCITVDYDELVEQYNKGRAMEIPILRSSGEKIGVNFVKDTNSIIGYSISVEDIFKPDGTIVDYIDVSGVRFRLEVK